MMRRTNHKGRQSSHGFTLIELLIVVAITGVLTVIAVPQMLVQRRLTRTAAMNREIMTSMRYARQLAMSQKGAWPLRPSLVDPLRRVAYTFQYDDSLKQISIIGPIPAGPAALIDGLYPNNTGSAIVTSALLTQAGLTTTEIKSGIPAGLTGVTTTSLVDGTAGVDLAAGKLYITFQPDGSVIGNAGIPVDKALFIYNNKTPTITAAAISVRGASGRVKIWRYNSDATAYIE